MVVQIFIPQGQSLDSLGHQFLHAVLDLVRPAVIGEARRQACSQTQPPIDLAQQQAAGVAGDGAAVEPRHHLPTAEVVKFEAGLNTLCRGEVLGLARLQQFVA
jgi:hypothetical protein